MAYESYYTNKIIKTTKAQYDALKNGESVKGYKLNEKDTFVLDIDSLYNDLNNYVAKRNQLENNVDLNTITTTGFYRLNNTHANSPSAPFGQMIVCQAYGDTIAQVVFRYNESKMFLRTGNVVNNNAGSWTEWKTVSTDDHTHTSLNTAFVFKNEDMPQGSANLSATTTAHKLTLYRNGLSVPYQMDNSNDGGILRCRGNSESNVIFELATWDDSGAGETIQFNYYPTNSQATPTYSVTVPKKTGTMALTGDIPTHWANIPLSNTSDANTTPTFASVDIKSKCTVSYSATADALEFIFK